MIKSYQTAHNKQRIQEFEKKTGMKFVAEESYKGKEDNHKFKVGDSAELTGLEDYPEFNGEIITISSIREDGKFGKAYYFKTDNKELQYNLNWTYEYRLKQIEEV